MTHEEKLNALFASADAYLARGKYIQYDQLSMDRAIRVTPRRRYVLPPEAATSQQRLYLDCATFVCAVFNDAFGYRLEADVTWNIRELVRDRVFYREFTGDETDDEKAAIKAEFDSILKPGDAVVMSRANNGHIMLYKDADTYYHCTVVNCSPGSYDYQNKRDLLNDCGSLRCDDPHLWTSLDPEERRSIFNPAVKKVAIVRPLNYIDSMTQNTAARLTSARDLFFEVTVSHPGGRTAYVGDTVVYTLNIRNSRDSDAEVPVKFTAPLGTSLLSKPAVTVKLDANSEASLDFEVRIDRCTGVMLASPALNASGLDVYAPPILLGKNLSSDEADTVVNAYKTALESGTDVPSALSAAYNEIGIAFDENHERLMFKLFYRHDSLNGGEVFSRRVQRPDSDMAVYSYFGGANVITPEVSSDIYRRTIQLHMTDLQKGDIILCGDDHTNRLTYSCMYTGEGFTGNFEAGGEVRTLCGDEAAAYLDSLMGRFAFIILRPSLNQPLRNPNKK